MNADELMKKIAAYGADETGIADRFGGNDELYQSCFEEFLEEPNFAVLEAALNSKDYKKAFEAAHALKGLSGNLGITAFYEAICVLVESLRSGEYFAAAAQYADVMSEYRRLVRFCTDEPEPVESSAKMESKPQRKSLEPKAKHSYLSISVIALLVIISLVGVLFNSIGVSFRENVISESGQHLVETNNQIQLYIEACIADDWRIAEDLCDSLMRATGGETNEQLISMLRRRVEIWGASDLMLYNENGYCEYISGEAESNDLASDTIAHAREYGRYMSVIDSKIIYTLPVDSPIIYRGANIAAISVVRNMETFLDDMEISAFSGQAFMYLTEESGIIISMLSSPSAIPAFNFKSVVENMEVTPLRAGGSSEDFFSTTTSAAFLLSDASRRFYVVSMPIHTGERPLQLFYLAPEDIVNKTTNGFSQKLTAFSIAIIAIFTITAFFTFMLFYLSRKKLFDRALLSRDRMFDLLVKNTQTAFGLFAVNQDEPSYISSNAESLIGDRFWVLDCENGIYSMRADKGRQSEAIAQINEQLRGWDGTREFSSGYIRNDGALALSYFQFELYPVERQGMEYVGIAQDVTQAYIRESATKTAMVMAERANEAKSSFLSNMSHDIRTPMNAIMNMTNFALEAIDQPKKLGVYLRTIRESSEHLLHLINDVLDMSRIESGQTVIANEPFDLLENIKRQVDIVRPLADAKKLTLIADFSGLFTSAVRGDSLKLSQIIMNLLSNAVKFTPDNGAVRFTAREIPSLREDMLDVRFTIEDNGIGIAEENLANIFLPFSRVADERVGKIEGTGLGLSICKSYVDAMGGSIHCESEVGEGSTFIVEMFFEKSSPKTEEAPNAFGDCPFLGMHALVVEDNNTNQQIAKSLLERTGFIVDIVSDGAQGVSVFCESKPNTFDVIYMDIQMPVMDGVTATVKIRSSSHEQAESIPIIAMTANVFVEDIERARIAGMDAYVGKPVVTFDLIEQTIKAINKRRASK